MHSPDESSHSIGGCLASAALCCPFTMPPPLPQHSTAQHSGEWRGVHQIDSTPPACPTSKSSTSSIGSTSSSLPSSKSSAAEDRRRQCLSNCEKGATPAGHRLQHHRHHVETMAEWRRGGRNNDSAVLSLARLSDRVNSLAHLARNRCRPASSSPWRPWRLWAGRPSCCPCRDSLHLDDPSPRVPMSGRTSQGRARLAESFRPLEMRATTWEWRPAPGQAAWPWGMGAAATTTPREISLMSST